MIDLGFVAKGYIADRMKEYLIANNVKSAVINLGGNVLTIGGRPDHTPFKVGIQKPFADAGTSILILDVQDRSLVSSGNYERFFLKEDVLYHHILSTSDGYPADSGLSGVTIISERSVDGDALSTYCFILGYEKGKKLIDSLHNTAGNSGCKAVSRNIFCHNGPCPDHAALPDCHTPANCYVCGNPTVISNGDRRRIL